MKIAKLKNKNYSGGYSLFLAIIILSALLIIAYSVVNISVKETQFATSGRESQFAYFAADAGIECALYWDAQTDAFATSSSHSTTLISCGGVSVTTGSAISGTTTTARIGGGGNGSVSILGFPLNYGDAASNSCVIVSVIKNSNMTTHINSYGYNTCNTSDLRRV